MLDRYTLRRLGPRQTCPTCGRPHNQVPCTAFAGKFPTLEDAKRSVGTRECTIFAYESSGPGPWWVYTAIRGPREL